MDFETAAADPCLLDIMAQAALLNQAEADKTKKSFARRWAEFEVERGYLSATCNEVTPETAIDAIDAANMTAALLLFFLDIFGQLPQVTLETAMDARERLSLDLEIPKMSPININFLLSLHLADTTKEFFDFSMMTFHQPGVLPPQRLVESLTDSLGVCISLQKLLRMKYPVISSSEA